MRILDSHFHWLPRSTFDKLCKRAGFPRAEADGVGGYRYFRAEGRTPDMQPWPAWFDLDEQFEHMDKLGVDVDVVSSTGPFSIYFNELPASEGRGSVVRVERRDRGQATRVLGPLLGHHGRTAGGRARDRVASSRSRSEHAASRKA